jgi:hypothetical protein
LVNERLAGLAFVLLLSVVISFDGQSAHHFSFAGWTIGSEDLCSRFRCASLNNTSSTTGPSKTGPSSGTTVVLRAGRGRMERIVGSSSARWFDMGVVSERMKEESGENHTGARR